MSSDIKRPLAQARSNAEGLHNLIWDACAQIQVAGSVRRKAAMVGDIEWVAQHKYIDRAGPGLFAEPEMVSALWERLDNLVSNGVIEKKVYGATGCRWGPLYRGVTYNGWGHEFFSATADTWGCQLLIRTGSAEFSKHVVTALLKGGMYRQVEGRLIHVASGETVSVPDERTYLKLAGMEWREPEAR